MSETTETTETPETPGSAEFGTYSPNGDDSSHWSRWFGRAEALRKEADRAFSAVRAMAEEALGDD